jgi:hypothetical protein
VRVTRGLAGDVFTGSSDRFGSQLGLLGLELNGVGQCWLWSEKRECRDGQYLRNEAKISRHSQSIKLPRLSIRGPDFLP